MMWQDRANKVIAQGCLTYSKRSDQFVNGVYPTHCFYPLDNNRIIGSNGALYSDFVSGLGANISGIDGCTTLPTTREVELAELICSRVNCIDKLRFVNSGGDACLAAVRIARAYTGRSVVVGSGYHGCGNMFIAAEIPGRGCVDEKYVKCGGLKEVIMKVLEVKPAAAIVEPVELNIDVLDDLRALRNACDECGTMLIFDEVITGWRVPDYTFSNRFFINPDLICLGKAVGNGHPVAVVGGISDVMDTDGWFISYTYAGYYPAINAAYNHVMSIDRDDIMNLWNRGGRFIERFNKITPEIQLHGYPTRCVWVGDDTYKAIFWQEMCKRKYLLGKAFFLRHDHTEDVLNEFISVSRECVGLIDSGATLDGDLPREVFKR